MSASLHDLNIERGAAKVFTLRIVDKFGAPSTITGGSTAFKAEIREAHRKPLISAFTITVVDSAEGTIRFTLSSADSLALDTARQYQWDFYWTDTSGVRRRLLYGSVSVTPNITSL
jgi:hypothetical protein